LISGTLVKPVRQYQQPVDEAKQLENVFTAVVFLRL